MANLDKLLAHELAKLLGCNRRSVSRWARDEGLPKNPDGTFNGPACVSWLIERIEAKASEDKCEQPPPGSEWLSAFRRERYKLAKIERKEREGELIPRADAHERGAKLVGAIRIALHNLAPRLAAQLVGLGRREVEQVVELEVYALESILHQGRVYDDQSAAAEVEACGGLTPGQRLANEARNQHFGLEPYYKPRGVDDAKK